MNKKALMLLANSGKGKNGRRVGVEYEDWGMRDRYPMIEPYEGGYGPYPMEDKFRDRRGREHYDNGRFAPRSDYTEPWMDHRRTPPTFDEGERKMNPIGFARSVSDATVPQHHEMDYMQGRPPMQGYASSEYAPKFDRQMAEEWAAGMENEDGTTGPHWSLEQAKQVMAQKEIGGSPLAFYLALNMMYSDYCKVAKKLGVNTVDFYACMADAFLNDKDAVGGGGPEKLAAYYNAVVQH